MTDRPTSTDHRTAAESRLRDAASGDARSAFIALGHALLRVSDQLDTIIQTLPPMEEQ